MNVHVCEYTVGPSPAAMEDDDWRKACVCGRRETRAQLLQSAKEYAEGYRLCDHGYSQVCYACGRGFDENGRLVGAK